PDDGALIPGAPLMTLPRTITSRRLVFLLLTLGCIVSVLRAQSPSTPGVESTFLEPAKTVEGQLAAGQSNEYHFTLLAGHYARVLVDQRSINVAIACFGPDGKDLVAADSFEIGDAESAELIGDVSGTYRLRLTASEPKAPQGRYEITLRDVASATD